MKKILKLILFALFFSNFAIIHAIPQEELAVEEIFNQVRLSRIPKIIEILEAKARDSVELKQLTVARDYLIKALELKTALGMRETESSANLMAKISTLESKLGNQCEALRHHNFAKRIYRQIGVEFTSPRNIDKLPLNQQVSCIEI